MNKQEIKDRLRDTYKNSQADEIIDEVFAEFEKSIINALVEAVNRGYSKAVEYFESKTCKTCELYDGKYCLKFNVFHVTTHSCKEWKQNEK